MIPGDSFICTIPRSACTNYPFLVLDVCQEHLSFVKSTNPVLCGGWVKLKQAITSQIKIHRHYFFVIETVLVFFVLFFFNVQLFVQSVRKTHLHEARCSSNYNLAKSLSMGQTLVWLVVSPIGDTFSWFEPPHDNTNKMSVRPANTQISLGIRPVWSESSLFAWRKLGSLATHWAHSEDWSDRANTQADLSLRWAHMPFVWFYHLCFQHFANCRFEVVLWDRFHGRFN